MKPITKNDSLLSHHTSFSHVLQHVGLYNSNNVKKKHPPTPYNILDFIIRNRCGGWETKLTKKTGYLILKSTLVLGLSPSFLPKFSKSPFESLLYKQKLRIPNSQTLILLAGAKPHPKQKPHEDDDPLQEEQEEERSRERRSRSYRKASQASRRSW